MNEEKTRKFGKDFLLTVIVPAFNEEENLPTFHAHLKSVVENLPNLLEVIYIDDGSTDGTSKVIEDLCKLDQAVGHVKFSRNFGKEAAVSAGLIHARGDVVVVIDADLQDPPSLIPSMIEAWERGADVVNMKRISRAGESFLKRATAKLFYKVINSMSDIPIPTDVGDFRLLSRRAVDSLKNMPEKNRFMKGLFAWIGFAQETIPYHRDARAAGKTKWPYWKLWRLALEGITGFSTAPLKLALYFGFLSSALSFCALLYFFMKTVLYGDPVPGFPALIVTMLFLGGVQIGSIGILGEYVARIFIESKGRPLFLVDLYKPANIEMQRKILADYISPTA